MQLLMGKCKRHLQSLNILLIIFSNTVHNSPYFKRMKCTVLLAFTKSEVYQYFTKYSHVFMLIECSGGLLEHFRFLLEYSSNILEQLPYILENGLKKELLIVL